MRPTTVLSIVGKGRSGSTILGDLLGSVDGVFHAGELWRIWSIWAEGKHSCSCGQALPECDVWAPVMSLVAATPTGKVALASARDTATRQRRLFTFGGLAAAVIRPRHFRREVDRHRKLMEATYEAIAQTTRARLIVDSSKWPLDPMLFAPPGEVEPIALHLVRDPEGVAASWRRVKHFPDTGEAMPVFSRLHSAASWNARNLAAEWTARRTTDRFMRVRYEDFAAGPREVIEGILSFVDDELDCSTVFANGSSALLAPGHTIMGNPTRFQHGQVEIKPQPAGSHGSRLVRWLTYPLRKRYGYA
ncbi:MAG: sulfotransferase [Acidimicrobiia bacterium]|nr:sulfotransferase [Acidimicrobiia bacterium]